MGIISLIAISVLGSYAGDFVDQWCVGILGLFPIHLAVKHLIANFKRTTTDQNLPDAKITDEKASDILALQALRYPMALIILAFMFHV